MSYRQGDPSHDRGTIAPPQDNGYDKHIASSSESSVASLPLFLPFISLYHSEIVFNSDFQLLSYR